MKTPLKVLLVEDEDNDAVMIRRHLHKDNFAVVDVCDRRETLEEALQRTYDVILLDLKLNGLEGAEAMPIIRSAQPQTPVVIVTGSVDDKQASLACRNGARDYLLKDRMERLQIAVENAHRQNLADLQAIRDQRVEIIGNLTSGLIHDFNNLLAVQIMGNDQLRTRINPMDERILDAMLSAAKRGAEMTSQILTFMRGANGSAMKSVNVQYLLGQVGQLIRATFPPNIRVDIKTSPGTSSVKCDATQIIQAITNLCVNSRDEMKEGGTLTIEAQNVSKMDGISGPCVCVSVKDTGSGIPEAVQLKVWEPFYTTKGLGFGTGLGLPTVKRIVEAHHGDIRFITSQEGTTFYLSLPIALPWTSATDEIKENNLNGEGKCVLVVDDEQFIREMIGTLLEATNYKVILAQNGPEALSHFRAGVTINLLLTDQSMGLMTGTAIVKNLRASGITTPAIIMSGFDTATTLDVEVEARLQKPISRQMLLSTLHRVLTAPIASAP